MDVLIVVGVLIAVAVFVAWPLYTGGEGHLANSVTIDSLVLVLRDQRDKLLHELAELELDHDRGVVADSDYEARRSDLESAAADAMRRIEELEASR